MVKCLKQHRGPSDAREARGCWGREGISRNPAWRFLAPRLRFLNRRGQDILPALDLTECVYRCAQETAGGEVLVTLSRATLTAPVSLRAPESQTGSTSSAGRGLRRESRSRLASVRTRGSAHRSDGVTAARSSLRHPKTSAPTPPRFSLPRAAGKSGSLRGGCSKCCGATRAWHSRGRHRLEGRSPPGACRAPRRPGHPAEGEARRRAPRPRRARPRPHASPAATPACCSPGSVPRDLVPPQQPDVNHVGARNWEYGPQ